MNQVRDRDLQVKIVWTRHAEERQREWEKKLQITRDEVESLLTKPAQVLDGDMGILVAQGKKRMVCSGCLS